MCKWYRVSLFFAVVLAMGVSCRQLYTTSLGTAFARDGLTISKNTSIADLLTLSQSSEGSSPEAAKEILDILAGKDPEAIEALSVDDKASILNMATSAAINMTTLSDLAATSTDAADANSIIETALSAFDSSVNLAAVEILLADTATLESAPIDTIVLASAVVLADVAAEIGTEAIMDIMATGDTTSLSSNPEQLARVESILAAREILDERALTETSSVSIAGFNLTDLLGGTQI